MNAKLENRIKNLESSVVGVEPIKISWFFVWPGRIDDVIGFTGNEGTVIMRLPNETMEELEQRCDDVPGTWHSFEPIFTESNHGQL